MIDIEVKTNALSECIRITLRDEGNDIILTALIYFGWFFSYRVERARKKLYKEYKIILNAKRAIE